MSDLENWVIAWVIPKNRESENCWIMVRHKNRGWELLGGNIRIGESVEEAALRELFEETGLLGTAKAVENKLFDRGIRIIQQLTNVDYEIAKSTLIEAEKSVKTAIVMIKKSCSKDDAKSLLDQQNGLLRKIIE